MRCPRCKSQVKRERLSCPNCGAVLATSGVMKTSSILIASDDTEGVYRSVEDVPEQLREKLAVATQGLNSATILIADRRGREEIARALRKLPSGTQRRLFRSWSLDTVKEQAKAVLPVKGLRISLLQIVGILVAASSGALIWLILSHNW